MPKQVRINFYAEEQQPSPISSVEMALPSLFRKIYRELSQEEKQTIQYTSFHVAIRCNDAACYAHFDLLKNWLDRIEIIFNDEY